MDTGRILSATFILIALASALSSCAPERAEALRAEKSLTLGVYGASYRPTPKVGIGATGNYANREKTTVNTQERGIATITKQYSISPNTYESNREIEVTHWRFDPFVQYFPWSTSAFFLGVAGRFDRATYRFDEETQGSTSLAPAYTDVTYDVDSVYVGVPAGWAWIWESGFSLGMDFGPRFRVQTAVDYRNDGTSGGVNSDKRDNT